MTELIAELTAYLDSVEITCANIGDIRRSLFVPWKSEWNGLVRYETAQREKHVDTEAPAANQPDSPPTNYIKSLERDRRYFETELTRCGEVAQKLRKRVKAFQEGYRDKSFEVTALEIQIMDLKAHGIDNVTARINESLKTKMLAVCIERNEAQNETKELRARLVEMGTP